MTIGCAVVTYNSASQVPTLLDSLSKLELEALAVVDNGSRDSTVEIVRSSSLPFAATVIECANRGYAVGANTAIDELRRQEVGLVLLLNPDAVVLSADLAGLERIFGRSRTLGSLCPVMIAPGGRTFDSVGLRLTPWGSVGDAEQGRPYRPIGTSALRGVIGPCGGGAVYRLAALESLPGPFDERFFLYYEDADLALRLKRLGWGTVTSDLVTVEHRRGGLGSLSTTPAYAAHATALARRQRSYELFLRNSPLPLGRRLLGRPAARARRVAIRSRLSRQSRATA
ncbi:MAG TPA: glycosyltransferase family 2 protein [Gaiellaceae bacterium]|jgi:GT2 family glycosyltransferase|nr:glycosyltransferase family 2 protein [Gaiellaceae bacterium]